MTDPRTTQMFVRSLTAEGLHVRAVPADRQMLMAMLVGKVAGICKGYSMASNANQAMADICDALIAYETDRAKSFADEDGPFSSIFATYAAEAREAALDMQEAKERWA